MEFDACILVGELPFDGNRGGILLREIGGHFPAHLLGGFDSPVQASSDE